MLKPSDLTKAELLQVMEILSGSAEYELERALSQIERKRNDAHYKKSRRLIDEEKKALRCLFCAYASLYEQTHYGYSTGHFKTGEGRVGQGPRRRERMG